MLYGYVNQSKTIYKPFLKRVMDINQTERE